MEKVESWGFPRRRNFSKWNKEMQLKIITNWNWSIRKIEREDISVESDAYGMRNERGNKFIELAKCKSRFTIVEIR